MKPVETLNLNSLGGQITWRRQMAGWTLDELSRRAGVSRAHICTIETGKTPRPSVYTVQRLAVAFGVSIEALIGVPFDASATDDDATAVFGPAGEGE